MTAPVPAGIRIDHAVQPAASSFAGSWYAVRVRSNFEFITSRLLHDKGFEDFLPVYRSRRQWCDRVKELDLPLFSGYVFCRFAPDALVRILNTPGVVEIISAARRPIPIDEREIDAIRAICRSGLRTQPWPFLEVGRRVAVTQGPLAGTEGFVVEMKNQQRLVVSISLLQRSVAAEIERDWIQPLSAAARHGVV